MIPSLLLTCLLAIPAAEPAPKPPVFLLHKADGTRSAGTLTEIGDGWSVALTDKELARVRVGGDNVVSLRRSSPPPPFPAGPQLLFANGDRLAGKLHTIAREVVAFTPEAGSAEISAKLSDLAVVWLAAPNGEADPALLRRRLLGEKRKQDTVALRNGDVIEGTLGDLDKDGLHVEVDGKDTLVERSKVAYVALSTELASNHRPRGPYARLTLADGSRLALTSAKADETTVTGRTLFGANLRLPVAQVAGLDVLQGRAVALSELKPKAFRHTPWSEGLTWPCATDTSVGGHDLRLGGGTYDRGLGMHCKSEVTFALGGAYQRFEALVGLDDHEGREGVVRVRVLVDGKPADLGWDRDLTVRDGAKALSVRVAGAEEITLVVERGRGGWWDQQGHVNWVDARLVK